MSNWPMTSAIDGKLRDVENIKKTKEAAEWFIECCDVKDWLFEVTALTDVSPIYEIIPTLEIAAEILENECDEMNKERMSL